MPLHGAELIAEDRPGELVGFLIAQTRSLRDLCTTQPLGTLQLAALRTICRGPRQDMNALAVDLLVQALSALTTDLRGAVHGQIEADSNVTINLCIPDSNAS